MKESNQELKKLSNQIKELEEKIDLILIHLGIEPPPKEIKRAGAWGDDPII